MLTAHGILGLVFLGPGPVKRVWGISNRSHTFLSTHVFHQGGEGMPHRGYWEGCPGEAGMPGPALEPREQF